MGYGELIKRQADLVHDAAIATKILQYISVVRDNSDEGQARRWIWELIQNAKDVAYPGVPVRIRVEHYEDKIIFRHNGRPFKVKNMLSIINQVSSKDPEKEKGITGKFGTGFITTHLLSEKVKLESLVLDEGLPCKRFAVWLDRSGHTQEEIMEAVRTALKEVEKLDGKPDEPAVVQGDFNTSFTYQLEHEDSKKIALAGLEDLGNSVLYALAFTDSLGEIQVEDYVKGTSAVYRKQEFKELAPSGFKQGFCMVQISEERDGANLFHALVMGEKEGTRIGAELTCEGEFLPVSSRTPKIFVDFPLIGTERFPVPLVMNDHQFEPNEPRSWIPVVDKENSVHSEKNKAALKRAMSLYEELVSLGVTMGWKRFYEIAYIPEWKEGPGLSAAWVESCIISRTVQILMKEPVVETEAGMMSAAENRIVFPNAKEAEERKLMIDILKSVSGVLVPSADSAEPWNRVWLGMKTNQVSLVSLQELAENCLDQVRYPLTDITRMEWVHRIYEAVLMNEGLRLLLESGSLKLIPNQEGDSESLHLLPLPSVYRDPGLDEVFKDVAGILDSIRESGNEEPLPVRSVLAAREFDLLTAKGIREFPVEKLFHYIDRKSSRNLKVVQFVFYERNYLDAWRKAWFLMAGCCPDNTWHTLAQRVFGEEAGIWRPAVYQMNMTLWQNSIRGIGNLILQRIQDARNLKGFYQQSLCQTNPVSDLWDKEERAETVCWFNKFYKALFASYGNDVAGYKAYPDQKDDFALLQNLKRDDELEEELKDIHELLEIENNGRKLRERLLSTEIRLPINAIIQSYTRRDMAGEIAGAIQTILNTGSLSEAADHIQEACTMLLSWLQNHRESAELFPTFYSEEDRMKLLTPQSAAIMSRKAEAVSEFLRDAGLESLEEATQLLKEYQNQNWLLEERARQTQPPEWDVFNEEDSENSEFGRAVGLAGEKQAFERLVARELELPGRILVQQTDHEAILKWDENGISYEAVLIKPDTETYHQSGWDIKKTVCRLLGEEKTLCREQFYEVKTSVHKEILFQVRLSEEQFKTAVKEGKDYAAICIYMDESLEQAKDWKIWEGIKEMWEKGRLHIPSGKIELTAV